MKRPVCSEIIAFVSGFARETFGYTGTGLDELSLFSS